MHDVVPFGAVIVNLRSPTNVCWMLLSFTFKSVIVPVKPLTTIGMLTPDGLPSGMFVPGVMVTIEHPVGSGVGVGVAVGVGVGVGITRGVNVAVCAFVKLIAPASDVCDVTRYASGSAAAIPTTGWRFVLPAP